MCVDPNNLPRNASGETPDEARARIEREDAERARNFVPRESVFIGFVYPTKGN